MFEESTSCKLSHHRVLFLETAIVTLLQQKQVLKRHVLVVQDLVR